jgi:sulfur-carrier protein
VTVRVLYFAAVRELVGRSEELLELPASVRNVAELGRHLEGIHPELKGSFGSVRIAVNESFAGADTTLAHDDTVALIPPVAGG